MAGIFYQNDHVQRRTRQVYRFSNRKVTFLSECVADRKFLKLGMGQGYKINVRTL